MRPNDWHDSVSPRQMTRKSNSPLRVLRTSFRPGISSRHERQPGDAKTSSLGTGGSSYSETGSPLSESAATNSGAWAPRSSPLSVISAPGSSPRRSWSRPSWRSEPASRNASTRTTSQRTRYDASQTPLTAAPSGRTGRRAAGAGSSRAASGVGCIDAFCRRNDHASGKRPERRVIATKAAVISSDGRSSCRPIDAVSWSAKTRTAAADPGERERADERDRRDLLDLGGAEAVARSRVRPREAHRRARRRRC